MQIFLIPSLKANYDDIKTLSHGFFQAKQKTVETKEIRLSLNIDIGDFNTKVNQAKKFLAKGDKLKVSIRLRGREMAHPEIGTANMERFAAALGEDINVDKAPKLEGRQILMFVSSKLSK